MSDTFARCCKRSTKVRHRGLAGRALRIFEAGEIYHLTAHGIDDHRIFLNDDDRQDFVIRLRRVVRTYDWELYAYCLMDTHYHLLVGSERIADGMRVLNGGYARAFNGRRGRRGALFESRYRDRQIRDEEHLATAIEYIEDNRLLAGLEADWAWHSGALPVSDTTGVRHRF